MVIGVLLLAWWFFAPESVPSDTPGVRSSPIAIERPVAASAKGVIQLEAPQQDSKLVSPLQVSGFVYGNSGTVAIKLRQKESGVVVAEKTAVIKGQADQISFAESLQFALPVVPQPGVLEVTFKDTSGKGLDDTVSIAVNFPSDLGSGL